MRYVDANVVIRYLTQDDPEKGAACTALFRRVAAAQEEITSCEAVIAETVYVLSSRSLLGLDRADIRARLTVLLGFRGFRLRQKRVYLRALDLYAAHPTLDFEDALCVAHMEDEGISEILSYDHDFDRLPAARRVEP